jgi:hypothetical protein
MTTEKHDPWALLREARDIIDYRDCDCGNEACERLGVFVRRIDAALAEHERGAEERKARLDRVWWDALHQASREGLDLSETVRRADAAKEREQGDK